jgi:hypothetical protein
MGVGLATDQADAGASLVFVELFDVSLSFFALGWALHGAAESFAHKDFAFAATECLVHTCGSVSGATFGDPGTWTNDFVGSAGVLVADATTELEGDASQFISGTAFGWSLDGAFDLVWLADVFVANASTELEGDASQFGAGTAFGFGDAWACCFVWSTDESIAFASSEGVRDTSQFISGSALGWSLYGATNDGAACAHTGGK